jgi:hypothetical protein
MAPDSSQAGRCRVGVQLMHDARQTTMDVFLVRPCHFGSNPQTAGSNAFQKSVSAATAEIQARAVAEFDGFIRALEAAGVRPIVFADTDVPAKPDAVFPNNWVSFHSDGTVYLYPMEAPSRRAERRTDIIEALAEKHGFRVREIIDLSAAEDTGQFLEGTGSMVLDRVNRVIYAAMSSRTHMSVLADFAQRAEYEIAAFDAADPEGRAIYHTNVMMAIGAGFAVICADAIVDSQKRSTVLARLAASGREILEISGQQMQSFAGNLLELASESGNAVIVLSRAAYAVLTADQRNRLAKFGQVLPVAIETIEEAGGGSVRCMLAEIFLPRTPVTARLAEER